MPRPRILALIQAGGRGGRMDVLTRETPKPLLPFGGGYALIDFPLSNLRNSGVDDVWLSAQYLAQALGDAIGNGKAWDLDRHFGGFRLLVPQQGSGSLGEAFVGGNAEELLQHRDLIRLADPDVLVVMSADQIYRLDYDDVVAEHVRRGAECTIVTTEVDRDEARQHATVETDGSGAVTGFAYKPDQASTGTVAAEIFVYSPGPLLAVLEELHRDLAGRADPDPEGLGDFGERLIPALLARGRVASYPLPGYWRDLGRPETYVAAHRDLLAGRLSEFADPAWPVRTNRPPRLPAYVGAAARITDSLISEGCSVAGTVTRSVLGPGVRVEAGAVVTDCVVHADVKIAADAAVDWAVLGDSSSIGAGARVGAPADAQPTDGLVLIGRESVVADGAVIEPGARLEPGTSA